MSENKNREMLEKEAAVFEQELSDREMEKRDVFASTCKNSDCKGTPLRVDLAD